MTDFPIDDGTTFIGAVDGRTHQLIGDQLLFQVDDLAGTMSIVQQEAAGFAIQWDLDTPTAVRLSREYGEESVLLGELAASSKLFFDPFTTGVPGTEIEYWLWDPIAEELLNAKLTIADVTIPFTFGPVDPLATVVRYTTLAKVKDRLGIDTAETTFDLDLTDVIIAAEVAIDQHLGRSFPDTGLNPELAGIPSAVRQVATQASVRVWKEADRAGVVSGSDDWFGELDIAGSVYQVLMANPILVGLHVSWGASVGATPE